MCKKKKFVAFAWSFDQNLFILFFFKKKRKKERTPSKIKACIPPPERSSTFLLLLFSFFLFLVNKCPCFACFALVLLEVIFGCSKNCCKRGGVLFGRFQNSNFCRDTFSASILFRNSDFPVHTATFSC